MSLKKDVVKHSFLEDIQAMVIGTLLISLGVTMYGEVGLLTGGTAGLAFLVQYSTSLSFGTVFFVINLPFYWLSIKQMGWEFTSKTFFSVFLVSFFSEMTPNFIQFEAMNSLYASIVGGFLIGAGFLMLFRHNASLGGLNILARYLAQTRGVSMGKFQMCVDSAVIFLSVFTVDWILIVVSILGAIALNSIIAVNHKPGRYNIT
ncbi:YitT family protein [Marinomonas sp. 15G1-11]|uniref:YitT family protein n=1 Tax=Marinomonas phaeophyticola TaxID=3004091 RepID=A0ABT4JWG6_9GAMM|nr:YitT family protein [Marinomonas sp. 15G1-11]MCZ2722724.1 YitT family protein [Marinomonas sp. 15G1-11]